MIISRDNYLDTHRTPPKVPSEVWINEPNNTIECDHITQ